MVESDPSHWWAVRAVDFLILGLAVWRLTSLLVEEQGPWYIFERLRYWLGVRYDEHSERYGMNVIAEGLTCIWCASVWVAGFWAVLFLIFPTWVIPISLPFALSSTAILIERLVGND
jgi:hypothetical protein